MLKLGVCKPEQFFAAPPKAWLPYLYYRLSRSRVSLDLLGPAAESPEATLFERLMPHVQLSNGVFRTTFRQRFRNLDPIVNSLLADSFSPTTPLLIEDWAASACLTSAEWARTLFNLFPQARFEASDWMLFLIAVENASSGEIFIAEPEGRLLQYIRPPFVTRMEPPEPWVMPLNRLEYLRARSHWREASHLWPLPGSWLDSPRWEEPQQQSGYILRKLPLIHPEALAFARNDARFSIRRQSIFEPAKKPAHVIRSMNILNRNYFPEDQLAQGARSVVNSLEDGGIWILGRTTSEDPPVHDVTVFRKHSAGHVEAIERIGAGSEVTAIALAVNR